MTMHRLAANEVIWCPEYDGHHPAFYVSGDVVAYYDWEGDYNSIESQAPNGKARGEYGWLTGYKYVVPLEMVEGKNPMTRKKDGPIEVPQGFELWEPMFKGHKPPFYKDGDKVSYVDIDGRYTPKDWCTGNYEWNIDYKYIVPKEMVDGGDKAIAEFDVDLWLKQGLDNLDKLPQGVALPRPVDWAENLVRRIIAEVDDYGYAAGADLLRESVNAK